MPCRQAPGAVLEAESLRVCRAPARVRAAAGRSAALLPSRAAGGRRLPVGKSTAAAAAAGAGRCAPAGCACRPTGGWAWCAGGRAQKAGWAPRCASGGERPAHLHTTTSAQRLNQAAASSVQRLARGWWSMQTPGTSSPSLCRETGPAARATCRPMPTASATRRGSRAWWPLRRRAGATCRCR